MRLVRCPCGCGHVFDADDPRVLVQSDVRLSDDARALLANAPRDWRIGRPVPIRLMADLGGMSYRRARAGLLELTRCGYAATVPYRRGRVRYVGVPTMIREEMRRAA